LRGDIQNKFLAYLEIKQFLNEIKKIKNSNLLIAFWALDSNAAGKRSVVVRIVKVSARRPVT
jgi:hypothetical protein